jgi:peptidoglycan hydrolase-like protein with peptidoglycan-binding domain
MGRAGDHELGDGARDLRLQDRDHARHEAGSDRRDRHAHGEAPAALPAEATTGSDEIRQLQEALNQQGFDAGMPPDGKIGKRTTDAVKAFQHQRGLKPTGRMDHATVDAILAAAPPPRTTPDANPQFPPVPGEVTRDQVPSSQPVPGLQPAPGPQQVPGLPAEPAFGQQVPAQPVPAPQTFGQPSDQQPPGQFAPNPAEPVVPPAPAHGEARHAPLPDATTRGPDRIRQVQEALNQQGFTVGTPDGRLGKQTVDAIKAFQRKRGFETTGKLDNATVDAILAAAARGTAPDNGVPGQQPANPAGPTTSGHGGATMPVPPLERIPAETPQSPSVPDPSADGQLPFDAPQNEHRDDNTIVPQRR